MAHNGFVGDLTKVKRMFSAYSGENGPLVRAKCAIREKAGGGARGWLHFNSVYRHLQLPPSVHFSGYSL